MDALKETSVAMFGYKNTEQFDSQERFLVALPHLYECAPEERHDEASPTSEE